MDTTWNLDVQMHIVIFDKKFMSTKINKLLVKVFNDILKSLIVSFIQQKAIRNLLKALTWMENL